LLYRRWLERSLKLFFLLFAITTHFNEKDNNNSDDDEDNNWDEDRFEQEFQKTHDGKDWCIEIGGRDWYHIKGDHNENYDVERYLGEDTPWMGELRELLYPDLLNALALCD
jgi:hypothetical protein